MSISIDTAENKAARPNARSVEPEQRQVRRRPGPTTAQGLRHEQPSCRLQPVDASNRWAVTSIELALCAWSTPPAEDVGPEAQRSPGPKARGDRGRTDEAPAVRDRAHVADIGWNTNQRDESPPPEYRQGGDHRPSSERHGLEAER